MIPETEPRHLRRLESRALVGSTRSYHFAATKKAGAAPSAGNGKEVSVQRVNREQSVVPKLDRNTR
jgi:hypothetical protein